MTMPRIEGKRGWTGCRVSTVGGLLMSARWKGGKS